MFRTGEGGPTGDRTNPSIDPRINQPVNPPRQCKKTGVVQIKHHLPANSRRHGPVQTLLSQKARDRSVLYDNFKSSISTQLFGDEAPTGAYKSYSRNLIRFCNFAYEWIGECPPLPIHV